MKDSNTGWWILGIGALAFVGYYLYKKREKSLRDEISRIGTAYETVVTEITTLKTKAQEAAPSAASTPSSATGSGGSGGGATASVSPTVNVTVQAPTSTTPARTAPTAPTPGRPRISFSPRPPSRPVTSPRGTGTSPSTPRNLRT